MESNCNWLESKINNSHYRISCTLKWFRITGKKFIDFKCIITKALDITSTFCSFFSSQVQNWFFNQLIIGNPNDRRREIATRHNNTFDNMIKTTQFCSAFRNRRAGDKQNVIFEITSILYGDNGARWIKAHPNRMRNASILYCFYR